VLDLNATVREMHSLLRRPIGEGISLDALHVRLSPRGTLPALSCGGGLRLSPEAGGSEVVATAVRELLDRRETIAA